MRETWVRSLDWEDPLEKGKVTHSSILDWRIPWGPPGQKESDTTEGLAPRGNLFIYFLLFLMLSFYLYFYQ